MSGVCPLMCAVAESVDVTTIFDLYGPQVEPFSGDKESAVKKAIAQVGPHMQARHV